MTALQAIQLILTAVSVIGLGIVGWAVRGTATVVRERYEIEISINNRLSTIEHQLDLFKQDTMSKLSAQAKVINLHQKLADEYRRKLPAVANPDTAARWSSENEKRHVRTETDIAELKLEVAAIKRRVNRARETIDQLRPLNE